MMKYTLYALLGFILCFSNLAYAQTEPSDYSGDQNVASVVVSGNQVDYQNMRTVPAQNYGAGGVYGLVPARVNMMDSEGWSPSAKNYQNNNSNKNMMGANQWSGYGDGYYQCGGEFGMMRGVGMMFGLILVLAILFFVFRKYMHHKKHHHCKCVCNCGCNCDCCCECKCMDSINMIRDRYARGEIDRYEFEEKKKVLE